MQRAPQLSPPLCRRFGLTPALFILIGVGAPAAEAEPTNLPPGAPTATSPAPPRGRSWLPVLKTLKPSHARQLLRTVNAVDAGARITPREIRLVTAIARVHPAVVKIAGGTGVNLSPRGRVLTTAHVIRGKSGQWVRVQFSGGQQRWGRVTKIDPSSDLALVKLRRGRRPTPLPHAELAPQEPGLGKLIAAIGNPQRAAGVGPFHVSVGRIRWYGARKGVLGNMAHDAWTYWGHGGAPIVDHQGRVVGLHNSWNSRTRLRHGLRLRTIKRFLRRSTVVRPPLPPRLTDRYASQRRSAVNRLERGQRFTPREARLEHAIAKAHPAVVQLLGGSGVNIAATGLIITNHHVVAKALKRRIRVTFAYGRIAYGKVLKSSAKHDLALIKLEHSRSTKAFPVAQLAARDASKDDVLVAIGNPSRASGARRFHVSVGRVLAVGAKRRGRGGLAYSAWTYWGHSGSPLFNEQGKIIGIHNTWNSTNAWRHGLRLSRVKTFLRECATDDT